MTTSRQMIRQAGRELIPLTFRVLLAWYLVSVLLEFIFPGLISNYINLDGFIWAVILFGILTLVFRSDHR